MNAVIQFVLHLDQHLASLTATFGPWMLLLLFVIVFCETGLVVFPFLPGDSLLFAVGALTSIEGSDLELGPVILVLVAAAVLGDAVNSELGRRAGPRLLSWIRRRPAGAEHILLAERFFETHGGRAIVFARFLPFLRTFVPFVAGLASMNRLRFTVFNVLGGVLWVGGFCVAGHFFGNLPFVKSQFHFVILGIALISASPVIVELIRTARRSAIAKRPIA